VISLKRSIDDYEAQQRLLAGSGAALLDVLDAIGQYSVEAEKPALERLRSHLRGIADRCRSALETANEEGLATVRSDVRGSLREHRDQAQAWIENMVRDLNSSSEALGGLLSSMQVGPGDTEHLLQQQIAALEAASRLTTVEAMREVVSRTTTQLVGCAESLRREKDAIIFQLRNEIQTLQKSLDESQRSSARDNLTGLATKDDFVRQLRRAVVAHTRFGVLHVWLRNLRQSTGTRSDEATYRVLLVAAAKRIRTVLPQDGIAARWAPDVFSVYVPEPVVRRMAADLARCCGGQYTWVDDRGATRAVTMQCAITTLFPHNDDPDEFLQKLNEVPCQLQQQPE
jgi:GGDEF domain-containing protein